MDDRRNGVVCLLGAGASADAGYPMANTLLNKYRDLLQEKDDGSRFVAEVTKSTFSLREIFDHFWSLYETTSDNSRYLENFFAYYDNPDNIGRALQVEWGPHAKHFEMKCLRNLRRIAMELAYKELGVHGKEQADYLTSLFSLNGPNSLTSTIATLNFDFTLEQLANVTSIKVHDGFEKLDNPKAPLEWHDSKLEGLLKRWEHVSTIGLDFVGFNNVPSDHHLLLKLHGSIGWYSLEEGVEWLGIDELIRHNPVYRYFRVPYPEIWKQELRSDEQILSMDGDITVKAGRLWMKAYMAYAVNHKASPDSLKLELLNAFSLRIRAAKTLVVVGYSWADSHINDLLLSGVAQGAELVHIGMESFPEDVVKLWKEKFATTFDFMKSRLFVFGGGASLCLGNEAKVILPTGEKIDLNLVQAIRNGLSAALSLYALFPPSFHDDNKLAYSR